MIDISVDRLLSNYPTNIVRRMARGEVACCRRLFKQMYDKSHCMKTTDELIVRNISVSVDRGCDKRGENEQCR